MHGLIKTPFKNVAKLATPHGGACRYLSVWVPRERGKDEAGKDPSEGSKVDLEPVAAFSKPPPLPPLVGPLVALTLLEMGSDSDG